MKNSNIFENIKINLIVTVPCFIIFYLSTKDILLSFAVFIFLFSTITIWTKIDNNLGYKRHCQIIKSEGFNRFLLKGFRVEKKNKYVGINGVYRGYLLDIYYDWNTITGTKNYRALVINAYFKTPKSDNNEIDLDSLLESAEKYKNSFWEISKKKYMFFWNIGSVSMKNPLGIRNPSYEIIKQKIDILIDLLITENLKPVSRTEVIKLRESDYFAYIPPIEAYYKI